MEFRNLVLSFVPWDFRGIYFYPNIYIYKLCIANTLSLIPSIYVLNLFNIKVNLHSTAIMI